MVWPQNFVLVFVFLTHVVCDKESWKREIEYFEKVDLDCAKYYHNTAVIHSVQAWILPSGEIWVQGSDFSSSHVVIRNNGFVLSIDRLDDEDFGVYYCIANTGTNGTQIIKIGVNVDGAYYGPALMDDIKHDAMVGGIAAGVALILLIILWVVCAYCTNTPVPPNIMIIKNEPTDLSGDINMTKIGDSVYYNADEMAMGSGQKPKEDGKSETLSSSNSGDYHSIDSIDRNKKLQSAEPADVYM